MFMPSIPLKSQWIYASVHSVHKKRQNRHQNTPSPATGYVCIKVARVFSQRLGNFLCQYWMVIILSAPILWLQRGLLECVFVVLLYFLKRALKALRVVISEPTPLRDRQRLSDSMERIAKWTHAADSSFVESAANTSRNPETLPYQIVTMFHSAEV